jgi:hypothetical protein
MFATLVPIKTFPLPFPAGEQYEILLWYKCNEPDPAHGWLRELIVALPRVGDVDPAPMLLFLLQHLSTMTGPAEATGRSACSCLLHSEGRRRFQVRRLLQACPVPLA